MPTFIEKSSCRGNRPSGVVGLHHNLRSDITGALLKDRSVPRFLIAPMGYGKSSCAYEYAQVVFGFEHVFWVKCDSPCFLRDLDEGTIFSQMSIADQGARLAIFDDVPHLDQGRTEAFDRLLSDLMEAGIEVMATCVPSVDTFSSRHTEKILLGANELSPTDDEVEIERMRGNISHEEADELIPSRRAACLLWGEGGTDLILKGLAAEELPGELELALFCMLVLVDGRIEDLSEVMPTSRVEEDAAYLASMFPYLGIDMDAGTFDCMRVSPTSISAHSKLSFPMLGKVSSQGDREGLALLLADALLDKGLGERATEFVRVFGTRPMAAKWLCSNGWDLLSRCLALPVEILAARSSTTDSRMRGSILALQSWALAMLDDKEGNERAFLSLMRLASVEWQDVVAAAISRCILGDNPNSGAQGSGLGRALALKDAMDGNADAIDDPSDAQRQTMLDWGAMLELECLRCEDADAERYVECFQDKCASGDSMAHEGGLRNALLVSGAWFLKEQVCRKEADAFSKGMESDTGLIELCAPIVSFLSHELGSTRDGRDLSWAQCVAVDAVDAIGERCPYAFDEGVSPRLVSIARSMAVRLLMQADEHRRGVVSKEEAKAEYELTHEDAFRAKAQTPSKMASLRVATPSLVVSLFGGVEAWVGTDGSDPRQIKRKNAKIALAMLAMNRGREITKERMARTLWPEASVDSARQNLYVVWAYLKKVLKVGSSCPYLISTQTGYKLDARYVISDSQRFEELCKDLLFGRNDKDAWEELYEKVSGDFAEDLLPEITDNAYIEALRRRYKTQMVDGLVEASNRMGRDNETRGAIWFAREALRRDPTREDAYIALMEAQIASNQRGAALDTYFECRRHLSEQLGIDPSRRVVELYRSVIETEEDF